MLLVLAPADSGDDDGDSDDDGGGEVDGGSWRG